MDRSTRPISIAIQAMGGQGGGVLADWIVGVAEASGYIAQTTSVPGVAQRTGATVYYVEIFPEYEARKAGRDPVLALMPSPGDVDIVIGAELMEAGRTVQRGWVTPKRTTLIASTHRVYAISEKTEMGDGILDDNEVLDAGKKAARKFIYFDMARVAESHGSVISSSLLGALAGSQALPFERGDFEDAIRRGGIGVEASLAAFADAYERSQGEPEEPDHTRPVAPEPQPGNRLLKELLERARNDYPQTAHFFVVEGMRRCADYQDPKYAREFLDRLDSILECDKRNGGENHEYILTSETARYLALWMSYQDTIRVADQKIRASRFKRFQKEVRARDDQLVYVSEYMHPRIEEICDMLPAWMGRMLMNSKLLQKPMQPFLTGHRVSTAKLSGFLMLWLVSRMRPWRRSTLRYQYEMEYIDGWLKRIRETAGNNYALAVEIARLQRLIKGYSDTHARGWANFNKVLDALDAYRGPEEPAQMVRRLRNAALEDESGSKLARELLAINSQVIPGAKGAGGESADAGGPKAPADTAVGKA